MCSFSHWFDPLSSLICESVKTSSHFHITHLTPWKLFYLFLLWNGLIHAQEFTLMFGGVALQMWPDNRKCNCFSYLVVVQCARGVDTSNMTKKTTHSGILTCKLTKSLSKSFKNAVVAIMWILAFKAFYSPSNFSRNLHPLMVTSLSLL